MPLYRLFGKTKQNLLSGDTIREMLERNEGEIKIQPIRSEKGRTAMIVGADILLVGGLIGSFWGGPGVFAATSLVGLGMIWHGLKSQDIQQVSIEKEQLRQAD